MKDFGLHLSLVSWPNGEFYLLLFVFKEISAFLFPLIRSYILDTASISFSLGWDHARRRLVCRSLRPHKWGRIRTIKEIRLRGTIGRISFTCVVLGYKLVWIPSRWISANTCPLRWRPSPGWVTYWRDIPPFWLLVRLSPAELIISWIPFPELFISLPLTLSFQLPRVKSTAVYSSIMRWYCSWNKFNFFQGIGKNSISSKELEKLQFQIGRASCRERV